MFGTFWIGTRKTREELMKENPDVTGIRSNITSEEFRNGIRKRRDELLKREESILKSIPACFGEGGIHSCEGCDYKEECVKSRRRGRIKPETLYRPFTI